MEIRCIDPHVHCRDENEAKKSTILKTSRLAKTEGVRCIFDMPNCNPPIVSRERVKERLRLAEGGLVDYYVYVGLTADPDQIAEAVEVAKTEDKVCGLKLYAGPSVGNLSVTEESKQREIYRILANLDYQGVLAVHCEKESLFRMELWNPKEPRTWNLARPPESEIESVKDQIKFAWEANFKGNLHICHVSCPESVEIIVQARRFLRITCGVTPHHLLHPDEKLEGETGLLYKVNPPLRDEARVKKLRQYLKEGKIDWIETDHAPHRLEEKLGPPYASGIPSLRGYKWFLKWLNKTQGLSWNEIERLTYWNIVKNFGIKEP